MMKPSSTTLTQYEVIKRVKDLINASNTFKHVIFKSIVLGSDIDNREAANYLAYINTILRDCEEYVNDLSTKIKTADVKGVEHQRGIRYSVVKPFLYVEYDYASILRFTDELVSNINNYKIDNSDDIDDYFDYVVSKAFKERSDSIAGLLSDITEIEYTSIDDTEIKLFNGVKAQTLFQKSDRKEIYKSIEKTVNFLTYNGKSQFEVDVKPKVKVAFINKVIDYATYVVTAYITRICAVSEYALSFIPMYVTPPITESAEENITAPNISKQEFTFAKNIDESIAHDYREWKKYKETMYEWLKSIGAGPEREVSDGCNLSERELTDNIFASQLIGNPLIEYLNSWENQSVHGDMMTDTRKYLMNKINTLHEMIYNPKISMGDTTTPKQHLLHTVRGIVPKSESEDGYTALASDLIIYSLIILAKIRISLSNIEMYLHSENNTHEYPHNGIVIANKCALTLKDLYNELAGATLIRAKDIEMKLNKIRGAKDQALNDTLTLRVPGGNKDDFSQNDNMMMGVPETTRMATEIDNLYSIPSLEAMQMYDEYVRSLPGMENVEYYNEALDISGLISKFLAWIKGLAKQVERTFQNEKFKAAVKWVNDHKADLGQMTYNGILEVLPYKSEIKIDYMRNVISVIRSEFKPEEFTDDASVNEYINKVYGAVDEKVAKLFVDNSTDNARAVQLYRNWFLYGTDPATNNAEVKPIRVSNNDIKNQLNIWISTVGEADNIYGAIKTINGEIESAINDIKAKMAKINSGTTQTAQSAEPAPTMPSTQGGESGTTGETGTTQTQPKPDENKNKEENNFATLAVTKTQKAITNIWDSMEKSIITAITTQYKYIQEAYTIGRKVNK